MTDFQIESQLNQAGVPFTKDSFLCSSGCMAAGNKRVWGEYVSHGDYKFEPSSDELKVTTSAKFKDRDADITFVFDEDLYLTVQRSMHITASVRSWKSRTEYNPWNGYRIRNPDLYLNSDLPVQIHSCT